MHIIIWANKHIYFSWFSPFFVILIDGHKLDILASCLFVVLIKVRGGFSVGKRGKLCYGYEQVFHQGRRHAHHSKILCFPNWCEALAASKTLFRLFA